VAMELSNLAICYEAVQRLYRNDIVRYVRGKIVEAFRSDHVDQIGSRMRRSGKR
jgi:hypothetical protein